MATRQNHRVQPGDTHVNISVMSDYRKARQAAIKLRELLRLRIRQLQNEKSLLGYKTAVQMRIDINRFLKLRISNNGDCISKVGLVLMAIGLILAPKCVTSVLRQTPPCARGVSTLFRANATFLVLFCLTALGD